MQGNTKMVPVLYVESDHNTPIVMPFGRQLLVSEGEKRYGGNFLCKDLRWGEKRHSSSALLRCLDVDLAAICTVCASSYSQLLSSSMPAPVDCIQSWQSLRDSLLWTLVLASALWWLFGTRLINKPLLALKYGTEKPGLLATSYYSLLWEKRGSETVQTWWKDTDFSNSYFMSGVISQSAF